MAGANKTLLILLVACIACVAWGSTASATRFSSGQSIYIADSVEINDDFFATAQNTNVNGHIRGDLVIVGMSAGFDGEVDGSVMVGVYDFDMSGHCRNSVRAFAKQISIDGHIERNLMVFGADVVLGKSGWVEKDVHFGGGTFLVQGRIGGILRGSGDEIFISGQIDGNVYLEAGKVVIQPTAIIGGMLEVCGKNEPKIEPGAQILGEISHCSTGEKKKAAGYELADFFIDFWSFLALALTGGMMLAFFKGFTREVTGQVKSQWLKSLGLGFVFFICLPIAAVILMVTLVGLPLGLMVLAGWLVLFYLTKVFGGIIIGDWILRKLRGGRPPKPFWAMVLGLLIIILLLNIPVLWVPIKLALIFLVFGGFFLAVARRNGRSTWENGAKAVSHPIE